MLVLACWNYFANLLFPRPGESLDDSFSKWEQLLQMIIENHPTFLTTLVEEMVKELVFTHSSHSNDDNNAFCEAIYMWLDHILKSSTWETSRRLLSPAYILAAGDSAPNRWTKLLKADLEKGSDNMFFGTMPDSQVPARKCQSDKPEFADRVSEGSRELAEYGWQVLDKWDCRPLGVA